MNMPLRPPLVSVAVVCNGRSPVVATGPPREACLVSAGEMGPVTGVSSMTAAVLRRHGGPEVLEVRDDWPVPEAGPGQALVRVHAAALNNTDIWTREGAYGLPGQIGRASCRGRGELPVGGGVVENARDA